MSIPRCGPIPTPSHGRASCSWEARSRRKAIATRGEDWVALTVRTDREPRDAREQRGDAAGACCGRGGPLRHVGVAEQATVRHVEPDHRRVGVGAEHTVGGLGVLQHIGLADEVVAIAFLRPGLVSTLDLPMIVETRTGDGSGVRGRTIGNPRGVVDNAPPVHVALGVDGDGFVRRFTKLWKSVIDELEVAMERTKHNKVIDVVFCINYGGRAEIADACAAIPSARCRP